MAKISAIKALITQQAVPQQHNQQHAPLENTVEGNTVKIISLPEPEAAYPSSDVRPDLQQFLATLQEGSDWGYIPHVQNKILFKPGALKILSYLHYTYSCELLDKSIDVANSFVSYTAKITVSDSTGSYVAEAIGAANTKETKFAKAGFSAENLVIAMAQKRALLSCVRAIIVR